MLYRNEANWHYCSMKDRKVAIRPDARTTGQVFDRLVEEGMRRFRWSRKKAEAAARKYLQRGGKAGATRADPVKLEQRTGSGGTVIENKPCVSVFKPSDVKPKAPLDMRKIAEAQADYKQRKKAAKKAAKARAQAATKAARARAEIQALAPPKTKTLTPKQRLDRAVGPDDGKRRGGRMFLQGGSPGLGKR